MTLREFLECATDETVYYIGAEEGGGFYFIGHAKDALNTLEDLADEDLTFLKARIKNLAKDLKDLKLRKPKSDISAWKKLVNKKAKYLKSRRDSCKNWKPFLDREVLETYSKITDPGIAVITRGVCCVNTYWTIEETEPSGTSSSKMILHPDGYDNLRLAILERAAEDYKQSVKLKRKSGQEPKVQHLSSAALKAFFRSDWYDELCDLDGDVVMQLIEKQVIQEEIEEAQKAMEEAANAI